MRYYFIDQNQEKMVINLNQAKKDALSGLFTFNWSVNGEDQTYYLRKVANKFYLSLDQLTWSKLLPISFNHSVKEISLVENTFQIYRGYLPSGVGGSNPNELITQMPGKVVKLLVKAGDAVKAGQTLLILEAMKMENEIKAPCDANIKNILVSEGATLESGHLMIELSIE
jgi:biotin carboxyl carrier protein